MIKWAFRDNWEHFCGACRRNVARRLERYGGVLHGGLLTGALLFFGFLGYSAQGRELFRVMLERMNPQEVAATAVAAFLLSTLLFFTYRSFLPLHIQNNDATGSEKVLSMLGLYGIGSAPFLACAVSIGFMWRDLALAREELDQLVKSTRVPEIMNEGAATIGRMSVITDRALPAMAIVAVFALLTIALLWLCETQSDDGLMKKTTRGLNSLGVSIVLALGVVATAADHHLLEIYSMIGPLAAGILSTIGMFMIGLAIAWLARVARVPGLVALGAVVLLYVFGVAILGSFESWQASRTASLPTKQPPKPSFEDVARDWITDRTKDTAGKKAPLVMISAQGGGMYAAIASSLFLARLQDREPRFINSLMAVSAVSGGSLGTALFDALSRDGGCGGAPGKQRSTRIEDGIAEVLQGSHFAPIIGNIPADLLRKLPLVNFRATLDRAEAFKESLVRSCPALGNAFDDHWSVASRRPALVLNTTWMSNGHRVAFAPFLLKPTGDGTLWSFHDVYTDGPPMRHGAAFAPTMADAAVTSARFPGALPPLSLTLGSYRHNYGDGGYADASGVTTAREMYEAVKKASGDRVAPTFVMLTFDYEPVTPKHSGTIFVDTLALFDAILGVRENLAGKAITGAVTELKDEALRFSLAPEKLGLALGLQLSRTSYDVLSLLVGRPEWCKDITKTNDNNAILRNSCVAARVLQKIRS